MGAIVNSNFENYDKNHFDDSESKFNLQAFNIKYTNKIILHNDDVILHFV